MSFQTRLRKARKNKGLTQEYVARILGITRQAYGYYESESSTREPDLDSIKRLAEMFDVSTDYLLGKSTNEPKSELEYFKDKIANEFPDVDLMFKDLESFTAEEMKEVYEYIKFKKSQKK